jgi:SSS family solute:Na+ symporter
MGLFWKKATNQGAIWGALLSIPVAMYFKVAPKGWSGSPLFLDLPFLDQMGLTSLVTMGIIALVSARNGQGTCDSKAIELSRDTFRTDGLYNVGAFAIMIVLVALYAMFWS